MKKLFLAAILLVGIGQILNAQTRQIGDQFGGGIVFHITDGGTHGLIAEIQDQGKCAWDSIPKLINLPENHSDSAKVYNDWRLPTCEEFNLLMSQNSYFNFAKGSKYWTSSVNDANTPAPFRVIIESNVNAACRIEQRTKELNFRAIRSF